MLHKLLILLSANAVLVAVWIVVLKQKRDLLIHFLAAGLWLLELPKLFSLAPAVFFTSLRGVAIFTALASLTAVLTRALVRTARAGDVEINHVVPFQSNAQKPHGG